MGVIDVPNHMMQVTFSYFYLNISVAFISFMHVLSKKVYSTSYEMKP